MKHKHLTNFKPLFVCVIAVAMNLDTVDAQVQPRSSTARLNRGFNATNTSIGLITDSEVQKELGIDPEVSAKIRKLKEEFDRDIRLIEAKEKVENDRRKSFSEDFVVRLRQILDAHQWERVTQIAIQMYGVQIFSDRDIIAKLRLTAEQRRRILELNNEYSGRRWNQPSTPLAPNGADNATKTRELNEKHTNDLMEVLTEDQKKQLGELKGKDFSVESTAASAFSRIGFEVNPSALAPSRIRQVVSIAKVLKELELSKEQAHELYALLGEYLVQMQEFPATQTQFLVAERNATQDKANSGCRDLLTADQAARLEQIRLQSLGDQVYFEPSVVHTLELSQEQQNNLMSTSNTRASQNNDLIRKSMSSRSSEDRASLQTELAEIRQVQSKELLEILTVEQQERLNQLKGKEFDVKLLQTRIASRRALRTFPNELVNSKFEAGTDGWSVIVHGAQSRVEVDPETVHEGKQSLKASADEPSDTMLGQEIMLRPGGMYRFRGWVKTKDLDPKDASVYGTFQIQTENGGETIASGPNHRGTTDWSEVIIPFEAPRTGITRIAPFYVGFGRGTGTVWFAELSIEEFSLPELVDHILAKNQPFDFDFAVNDISGRPLNKAEFAGKVLIVDVWGTWCPPCRREIPHFVELQKKFADSGLAIVGLNRENLEAEKALELVQEFYEKNEMNYRCGLVTNDLIKTIPDFSGFPTTMLFDRTGKVRARLLGYQDYSKLEMLVQRLLDEAVQNQGVNPAVIE